MGKQLTKVNEVYEYLMSELIQRNYKSGERLVISQISKKCNTSETPVREALRMLESDGYVKISANWFYAGNYFKYCRSKKRPGRIRHSGLYRLSFAQ